MEPTPYPENNYDAWYRNVPQPVDQNSLIWRYMDFTKFVSLLESRKLFFSRLDLLGDPFEGSTPVPHANAFEASNFDSEIVSSHRSVNEAIRTSMFVSCWHLSEFESDALWKLYGPEGGSVAICSKYSKLRDLPDVKAGLVKYVDCNTEVLDQPVAEARTMLKRRSFEYEKEVRALVWSKFNLLKYEDAEGKEWTELRQNEFAGIPIAVNLSDFLYKVVISPVAHDWFAELVEKILLRYQVDVAVEKSELSQEPAFEGMRIGKKDDISLDSAQ